ncbi:phospholipid scramblase 2-like isoform X2 [Anthonomus grandis grandis]|uniref:phospholipid scramblase 2-like isoform X2 n=1 Tax=Anthonomus grandis grandis TaxID=2921223 RepID=UPI0021664A79|nr:phospholipid scramblase 2-like isoform X2 [Anthonomus grandis grandis]
MYQTSIKVFLCVYIIDEIATKMSLDHNFNAFNNQAFEEMEGFNYSSSLQHVRTTESNVISSRVISSQPSRTNHHDPGTRRPIPISIIDRDTFGSSFQAPVNGLDFMRNADQLIIQQNCDLTDLMANTENRYTVKIPARENAEAIYYATESSKSCERCCFGSGRSFSMRLYDRTDQEALSLKRRLACGYCTFMCHLQKMEVWIPPGELVGTISQQWKPLQITFEVCNRHEQVLYIIEGPRSFSCCHQTEMLQIYTSDGSTQIGTIVHQWDPVSVRYQLLLQMPSSITDNRHKALLLGSAFLVEYMFFESSQKKMSLGCLC